jgi:PAS domain S-box-containing protein
MLPIVEQMMSFVRKGSADKRGRSEDREERVRRGLELAPVGIALATLDGHWLYVNDRFGAMTGYAREQLARFSFDHLTHPDDARRESAFLRKLLDAEIESFRIVKRVMSRGG